MANILHRSVGKYSGPVVLGVESDEPVPSLTHTRHIERAYWLTFQAETGGRVGAVMMADGTAFTIGQDQHIAVYPRELAHEDYNAADDQGSAWKLLAAIERAQGPVEPLWVAFHEEGWYVSPDGSLRWLSDGSAPVGRRKVEHKAGDLVHGAVIRNTITPVRGVVERDTPGQETARRWAKLLHELTAHESTQAAQRGFGLEHLIHRVQTRKLCIQPHRRWKTVQQAVYGPKSIMDIKDMILDELDLALCVLHSYTVNAPAIAFRLLADAITSTNWNPQEPKLHDGQRFARDLLRRIKNKRYGRWDKRWDRTRKAAIRTGWWPPHLFRDGGVMTP